MRLCEIRKEQCDTALQIEVEFGTGKALDYLIGEKFLNFLEAPRQTPTSVKRSCLRG